MTDSKKIDIILQQIQGINTCIGNLDNHIGGLGNRMDKMQGDINAIKNGQQVMRQELRQTSDKVNDTYNLALDNWGQVEESKARLSILEN